MAAMRKRERKGPRIVILATDDATDAPKQMSRSMSAEPKV